MPRFSRFQGVIDRKRGSIQTNILFNIWFTLTLSSWIEHLMLGLFLEPRNYLICEKLLEIKQQKT